MFSIVRSSVHCQCFIAIRSTAVTLSAMEKSSGKSCGKVIRYKICRYWKIIDFRVVTTPFPVIQHCNGLFPKRACPSVLHSLLEDIKSVYTVLYVFFLTLCSFQVLVSPHDASLMLFKSVQLLLTQCVCKWECGTFNRPFLCESSSMCLRNIESLEHISQSYLQQLHLIFLHLEALLQVDEPICHLHVTVCWAVLICRHTKDGTFLFLTQQSTAHSSLWPASEFWSVTVAKLDFISLQMKKKQKNKNKKELTLANTCYTETNDCNGSFSGCIDATHLVTFTQVNSVSHTQSWGEGVLKEN